MFKWKAQKFYHQQLIIGDGKETSKKLKIFGYSMLFGLVITLIMISIAQINLGNSFINAFRNLSRFKTSQDRFLMQIAIFGLAGIAVGISFKTGLFNIGVSGQMMFSGLMAGVVALVIGDSFPPGLGQILMLIIAVVAGAFLAGLAGALKAYFGIHEVVSTILLNWIVFFVYQATVKDFMIDYYNPAIYGSNLIPEPFLFTYKTSAGKMGGVIALVLLIIASFSTYFLIYKTSFGQKMIIVGHNPSVAKASGINVKLITTSSMAISGAVAGLLGIVITLIRDQFLTASLTGILPPEGFNGIAIGILGFSNPLAILPVAIIFGFIQTIIANAGNMDTSISSLVMGIFILTSAISSLFIRFNARLLFLKLIWGKQKYAKYLTYQKELKKTHKNIYDQYDSLMLEYRLSNREIKQKIKKSSLKIGAKILWKLRFFNKNLIAKEKYLVTTNQKLNSDKEKLKVKVDKLMLEHQNLVTNIKNNYQEVKKEVKNGAN